MSRSLLTICLLFLLTAAPIFAQTPIEYEVSFPNAAHHEAEISITVSDAPQQTTFKMSRSSPGRYALHEFAKNIYDITAVNDQGDTLTVNHTTPNTWTVEGYDEAVTFHYTLYADHPDGTYSGIDETHAHLNMPATFAWAEGLEDRPIRIRFHRPEGSNWKAATQLQPTDNPLTFTAPNRDYFMDSPTELSDFRLRTWQVGEGDTAQTIRMAAHFNGSDSTLDRYFEMTRDVIREQRAIFGRLPEFDYGTYTFIADYLPWVYWDGMEHRNSTILIGKQPLKENMIGYFYTLSHEFIHTWNMERLRAASIEPFDFTKANMSRELWFGEGFTSYYDDLTMKRAGIIDRETYINGINRSINTVLNSPGRKIRTAVQMSQYSPYVDEAVFIDDQNTENTFISYYTWGAVIALGLDLELRTRYGDISLDDYMRELWIQHGANERPYRMEDLKKVLGEVTGDPQFASRFFNRFITGHQIPDFHDLLAAAGFQVMTAHPGKAVLDIGRVDLEFHDGRAHITSNTLKNTPLYKAGLDRRDKIISIAGMNMDEREDYKVVQQTHDAGDTVEITYISRGKEHTGEITFIRDPKIKILPYEEVDTEVTEEIKSFRKSWLGSKVQD